jgi:RNA polymerase sigma factor (sigma-70 family)
VSSPTDIELMDQVRRGDIRQLAHLFNRHHLTLFNYYLRLTGDRHLSEDMVQEVFFRMLKYRHTFRGDGEFLTWMYHLARNVHMDHYKKSKNRPAVAEDPEEHATEEPHAQAQLEQKQDRELLERALSKLPIEKKELLILSRYQELRYDAIAELLGCSVEAVKVRVHRAMNDLRTIFFQLSGEKANGESK